MGELHRTFNQLYAQDRVKGQIFFETRVLHHVLEEALQSGVGWQRLRWDSPQQNRWQAAARKLKVPRYEAVLVLKGSSEHASAHHASVFAVSAFGAAKRDTKIHLLLRCKDDDGSSHNVQATTRTVCDLSRPPPPPESVTSEGYTDSDHLFTRIKRQVNAWRREWARLTPAFSPDGCAADAAAGTRKADADGVFWVATEVSTPAGQTLVWRRAAQITLVLAGGRRSAIAMATEAAAMLGLDLFYVSWRLKDFAEVAEGRCRPALMKLDVKNWIGWMTEVNVVKALCSVGCSVEDGGAVAPTAPTPPAGSSPATLFGHSSAKRILSKLAAQTKEMEQFIKKEATARVKLLFTTAAALCEMFNEGMNANFDASRTAGELALAMLTEIKHESWGPSADAGGEAELAAIIDPLCAVARNHTAAMTRLVGLCEASEAISANVARMAAGDSFLARLWALRNKPTELDRERRQHWQFCAFAMVAGARYETLEQLDAASMMYYRVVEWCEQFRLATAHGVAVDLEGEEKLIQPVDQPAADRMFSGDLARLRTTFVSLENGYKLLANAGDPLGRFYEEHFTESTLQARNHSVFTHGMQNVSAVDFHKLKETAEKVVLVLAAAEGDSAAALYRECRHDLRWCSLDRFLDLINSQQATEFDQLRIFAEQFRDRVLKSSNRHRTVSSSSATSDDGGIGAPSRNVGTSSTGSGGFPGSSEALALSPALSEASSLPDEDEEATDPAVFGRQASFSFLDSTELVTEEFPAPDPATGKAILTTLIESAYGRSTPIISWGVTKVPGQDAIVKANQAVRACDHELGELRGQERAARAVFDAERDTLNAAVRRGTPAEEAAPARRRLSEMTSAWKKNRHELLTRINDAELRRRECTRMFEQKSCGLFRQLHTCGDQQLRGSGGKLALYRYMVHLIPTAQKSLQPVLALSLMHRINPKCQHFFLVPSGLKDRDWKKARKWISRLFDRAEVPPPRSKGWPAINQDFQVYTELGNFGGRQQRSQQPESLLPETLFRNFEGFRTRFQDLLLHGTDCSGLVAANITGGREKVESAIMSLAAASSNVDVYHLDLSLNWGTPYWCPARLDSRLVQLNARGNLDRAIQLEKVAGECSAGHFAAAHRLVDGLNLEQDGQYGKMLAMLTEMYHHLYGLRLPQAKNLASKAYKIFDSLRRKKPPEVMRLDDFPVKQERLLEAALRGQWRVISHLDAAVKLGHEAVQGAVLELRRKLHEAATAPAAAAPAAEADAPAGGKGKGKKKKAKSSKSTNAVGPADMVQPLAQYFLLPHYMCSIAAAWRAEGQYTLALSCACRLLGMCAEYRLALEWGVQLVRGRELEYVKPEHHDLVAAGLQRVGWGHESRCLDAFQLLQAFGDEAFFATYLLKWDPDAAASGSATRRESILHQTSTIESTLAKVNEVAEMRNRSQVVHGFARVQRSQAAGAIGMATRMFRALHEVEGVDYDSIARYCTCLLTLPDSAAGELTVNGDGDWQDRRSSVEQAYVGIDFDGDGRNAHGDCEQFQTCNSRRRAASDA